MENNSISDNIAYWKNEVLATEFMITHINIKINLDRQNSKSVDDNEHRWLSEKRNLKYELKEMKKNLNFWLWVNKNFGEGYEETFSHHMEDDE